MLNQGPGATVVRIHPVTGAQAILASGGVLAGALTPGAIAIALPAACFDGVDGQLLVADWQQDGNVGKIVRIHPERGAQSVLSSGGWLVDPVDLVLDANGDLLVADEDAGGGRGGVIRIDRTTGSQTPVSLGGLFIDPQGLVREASGMLLVADENPAGAGLGRVIRVDPTTGAQTLVASGTALTHVIRIALEASGQALVANAYAAPGVVRVSPSNGGQSLHPILVTLPYGVAVEASGHVLVTDRTTLPAAGFVRRFDPLTGTTSIASALLANPQGISIVPQACGDGFDNDGDGSVDFPADSNCTSATDPSERPPCADGVDNDGAGRVDFPNDPGCRSAGSSLENPQCQDGLNNDGQPGIDFDGGDSLDLDQNGFIDAQFNPATPTVAAPDLQCGSASGNRERAGCGLGFELTPLFAPLLVLRRRRSSARSPSPPELDFGRDLLPAWCHEDRSRRLPGCGQEHGVRGADRPRGRPRHAR